MTGPPPASAGPPTPGPRAVLRFGSWEGQHATGLTWEQLHLSGLTWEDLIWVTEAGAGPTSPTRVGLNGARRTVVVAGPTGTAIAVGGSRRSLVQTGPPGGKQHGRPGS